MGLLPLEPESSAYTISPLARKRVARVLDFGEKNKTEAAYFSGRGNPAPTDTLFLLYSILCNERRLAASRSSNSSW